MNEEKSATIAHLMPVLVPATLECLKDAPWTELTLRRIAERADLNLRDLPITLTKSTIGYAVPCAFDQALEDFEADANDPARDQLFDLLMLRYEAMEDYRAGIMAYLFFAQRNAIARFKLAKARYATARRALILAGLDHESDVSLPIKSGLLALTIRRSDLAWSEEGTTVYSKTMVTLQEELVNFSNRTKELSHPIWRRGRRKNTPDTETDFDIDEPASSVQT